jgi:O-antigen ligase
MTGAAAATWRRWPVVEALAGVIVALAFTRAANDLPRLGPVSLSFALHALLAAALLVWRPSRPSQPVHWAGLAAFLLLAALRDRPVDVLSAVLVATAWSRPAGAAAVRVTLALVAITLGVHGIIFRTLLEPTPYTALQRFCGFTGDPNDLTTVALIASAGSLARLLGPAGARTLPLALDLAAACLGAVAVVLSQSRLGLLAFVFLVAILAARRFRADRHDASGGQPRRVWLPLAAATAGLGLVVLAAPSRFWFRLFRLFEGKDLGYRPYLARTAWSAFCDHPWLGIGVGRFPERAQGLAPHSTLLEALAEGGLLHLTVLALGVWLVVLLTRRGPAAITLPALVAVALALIGPIDLRVLILAVAASTAATSPQSSGVALSPTLRH